MPLFQTISDLQSHQALIRTRAYGVIETRNGAFVSIAFKPWPKLISATEAAWIGAFKSGRLTLDRCRIYYNQPLGHQNYLALKFIESTLGTTLATLRRAMQVLDAVAQAKQTDAILAHVTNRRISDRLMRRWNWDQHLPHKSGRHFIKRFYGRYPRVELTRQTSLSEARS